MQYKYPRRAHTDSLSVQNRLPRRAHTDSLDVQYRFPRHANLLLEPSTWVHSEPCSIPDALLPAPHDSEIYDEEMGRKIGKARSSK